MNRMTFFLCAILALLVTMPVGASDSGKPLQVGWAVGSFVDEQSNTIGPSILHTRNGGRTWVEQADPYAWPGDGASDVSAVDKVTAWVAIDSAILHTRNGGREWIEQTLPEGVLDGGDTIKQVKALSRREAWAVSIKGTVLHTRDGGETWNIVEHPLGTLDVNRMDVIGCVDPHDAVRPGESKLMSSANIWIVDSAGGNLCMVHSLNNGLFWRRENIPYTGATHVHMLDAYSPRVAWAAPWFDARLYRTEDGGENWYLAAELTAANDIDDMCAPSEDTLWTVQYLGVGGGIIHHVRLLDAGSPVVRPFQPVPDYKGAGAFDYGYGGVTCVDDQTALVVGYRSRGADPSLPRGIILSTTDGGDSWTTHPIPADDIKLWKTSFVGARR